MKPSFMTLTFVTVLGFSLAVKADPKSLKDYASPFVLLPPIEWAGGDGSSPKEQAYFAGVLETYGFFLYGYWPRVPKAEQQFSDYRACVDANQRRNWPLTGWLFGQNFEVVPENRTGG